jgi:hypothetical protein
MPIPLLLYSTNTLLAYHINQAYYRELHYVWCSPFFGAANIPSPYRPNPPSSSPQEIYETLWKDVENNDRHSSKIKQNKAGLRRGAIFKHQKGDITDAERLEIFDKVRLAQIADFKPLLYVIPYPLDSGILSLVPVRQRANPLADEFIIQRLPRSSFDIIDP